MQRKMEILFEITTQKELKIKQTVPNSKKHVSYDHCVFRLTMTKFKCVVGW
jgi:hypothetical protein